MGAAQGQNAMKPTVAIKGTKAGLVVTLADGPALDAVVTVLEDRLREGAAFFKDARITLSVGHRSLSAADWRKLRELLAAHGVAIENTAATADSSRKAARDVGLSLVSPASSAQMTRPEPPDAPAIKDASEGILIKRTQRSGQSMRYPGHVVIVGDVHAGAEVVAGGDIVVWGTLAGTAHAGALGDATVGVYALQLAPTQLRIGGHKARPPERPAEESGPEMARVENGRIVVETWERGQ